MPNARHEGENKWPVPAHQQGQAAAPTPRAHPRKLRKSTDEDVHTESLSYPGEMTGMCRISDSRRFTTSQFHNFLDDTFYTTSHLAPAGTARGGTVSAAAR